jgi:hypothetical protein
MKYIKKNILEIINDNKNNIFEHTPTFISKFLSLKYDYNIEQDSYRLIQSIKYNKLHSDILYKRYRMYFHHTLYKSLQYISNVRNLLPINELIDFSSKYSSNSFLYFRIIL